MRLVSQVVCLIVAAGGGVYLSGCNPSKPNASSSASSSLQPQGRFLCQPVLHYKDQEPLTKGTMYFVHNRENRIAAVGSASNLNFSGTPLIKIDCLSIKDGSLITTLDKSWGQPGKPGSLKPTKVLSNDYFIAPVEKSLSPDMALELDDRACPDMNEKVWFPNKSNSSEFGYEWVDGVVEQRSTLSVQVRLAKQITLDSQSGSPVISATNGKVVGTMSFGVTTGDVTTIHLCPNIKISNMVGMSGVNFPFLEKVVGKR